MTTDPTPLDPETTAPHVARWGADLCRTCLVLRCIHRSTCCIDCALYSDTPIPFGEQAKKINQGR